MKHASLAILCIVGAFVALLWQPGSQPIAAPEENSQSIALGATVDSVRVLSSIKNPTEGQQIDPPRFQLPTNERPASGGAMGLLEQDQLDFSAQAEALQFEQKDIENMPLADDDIALVDSSVPPGQ